MKYKTTNLGYDNIRLFITNEMMIFVCCIIKQFSLWIQYYINTPHSLSHSHRHICCKINNKEIQWFYTLTAGPILNIVFRH